MRAQPVEAASGVRLRSAALSEKTDKAAVEPSVMQEFVGRAGLLLH
ncbi:MAG TPA: hypothetical protein VJ722_10640 [Rhodanobacteraceae bacterium]|nr:hypothetical protein [Rhodanobacteraceae bacterium]